MKTFYVWSGSLRGVAVQAENPSQAVDRAVRENLPCALDGVVRVSLRPHGKHHLDTYFHAPYEDKFPDLFDGTLEIEVARISKEK